MNSISFPGPGTAMAFASAVAASAAGYALAHMDLKAEVVKTCSGGVPTVIIWLFVLSAVFAGLTLIIER